MFLRVVLLSISILLSPIAKSMDNSKQALAFGAGILAGVGFVGLIANKYDKVCIGDRPYEGPYTIDLAISKTWKVADNRQKAIPIVSFYPPSVSDSFSTIMQTIKPSLWEYLTGNGTYKPIDNRVLTQLKGINFSGIIAALVHRQDTPDHSDQLHIFNINNKCIVKMWRKEDYSEDNSNMQNYKLPKITPEHTQKKINFGNYYIFVTTPHAEKHLKSGFKQMLKQSTGFIEHFTLLAAKKLCKDFDEEATFNHLLKSTIANSKDGKEVLNILNVIINQSKETCSGGEKMLLHIKK